MGPPAALSRRFGIGIEARNFSVEILGIGELFGATEQFAGAGSFQEWRST